MASLYLDDDLDPALASLLRQRGVDTISSIEAGTVGQRDELHPEWVSSHGRVLVSYNFHDFLPIAERWFLDGREHAGIILSFRQFRRHQIGELLRLLLRLLAAVLPDELHSTVRFLDEFREHEQIE
jgi:predicted nuclease of predicted toxin-antitoxin system